MKEIVDLLLKYKDDKYAIFQTKVVPNISINSIIGVRIPNCRLVAKEIKGSKLEQEFLNELPHKYYDENMLHSILLNNITKYDRAINETIKFLPYVDNWATCDTMHSKGLGKNKIDLMKHIKIWLKSNHTYTIRFAVDCLMNYFLDDESFEENQLEMAGSIKSDDYYVNMMIAWYIATSLAKQYDATIKYLEAKKLSPWVQNKAIQKAKESFRITEETKKYIETLKIK